QAKIGAAAPRAIASTKDANPRAAQIAAARRVKLGWRVAIETFFCARSSSSSQLAMQMQLRAHKTAKASADATKGIVTDGIAGVRETRVPAVKRMPIATSFAGSERQMTPSGWFITR